MRTYLLSSLFMLFAFVASAQSINGISIDSPNEKVIIYINRQKISLPTNSCFISNLKYGSYKIEAYTQNNNRNPIYREDVIFRGDIIYLTIGRGNSSNGCYDSKYTEMSPNEFNDFMNRYKRQVFNSDKQNFLNTALLTSGFNVDQVVTLLKTESFDSDKKKLLKRIYPNIVNKNSFYKILDLFTFSSDKKEITDFISSQNR